MSSEKMQVIEGMPILTRFLKSQVCEYTFRGLLSYFSLSYIPHRTLNFQSPVKSISTNWKFQAEVQEKF